MKNLITLIFVSLIITSAFAQEDKTDAAQAQQPIVINEEITIKSGDTKIIPLPRYTYIDRMTLEAKTSVFCAEDNFRISFDGFSSQSVTVEGGLNGFRSKIITANVNARNIEVYNSTNCKLKIKSIQVLPRRWATSNYGGRGSVHLPASEAGAHVSFLLEAILYLDPLVNDSDRVQYISSAKKVLGKALSVLNTAPETSQASLAAIRDVLAYLNASAAFYDRLATIEATFETAQEIQSVKATLERMTR